MDVLKKNLLEERLNKSPIPLFLHDSTIENLVTYGEQLIISYRLGMYHYGTNMDVFKDVINESDKRILIVRQIFDGVKIKEFKLSIEDIGVDILGIDNILMIDKNIIRFEIFNENVVGYQSKVTDPVVEFEFKGFKWEVIGEEECKYW
ncbi:MAG: hypothetical protein RR201_03440 [Malacoplasma sp.]